MTVRKHRTLRLRFVEEFSVQLIDRGEQAVAGERFTYQIQVNNSGPSVSKGWSITYTPDPGMAFVLGPADPDITTRINGDGTITFSSTTDLGIGQTRSFNVTLTTAPTPKVGSPATPAPAEVSIRKTAQTAKAVPGQLFTWQLVVTNRSSSTSAGWSVTDTIAQGSSFVLAPADPDITSMDNRNGTVTFRSATNLAPGSSRTFTYSTRIDAAAVTAPKPEAPREPTPPASKAPAPVAHNEDVGAGTKPPPAEQGEEKAELELRVTISNKTPVAGERVNLVLKVYNNGPGKAVGVQVKKILPQGYQFVQSSSPRFNAQTGIWTIGEIANGQVAGIKITAEVMPYVEGVPYVETAEIFAANLLK